MNLSQYRLAVDTGIPHSRVTAIIKGQRAVTPDTALRFARYFGTSAEFWLGLQKDRHPVKIDGKFNSWRVVRTAHDAKLAMRIGHGKVKSMQV
jgi:addiction module HigA family antidote